MYIYLVALYTDTKPGVVSFGLQDTGIDNVYYLETSLDMQKFCEDHTEVWYYDFATITNCGARYYACIKDQTDILVLGDTFETYEEAKMTCISYMKETFLEASRC